MGGHFEFCAFPQNFFSRKEVEDLFKSAASIVNNIEAKFTEFKDSPFNEINKHAGIKPVKVDDEIYALIKKSLEISQESNGIFDISTAAIGHAWRKAKQKGEELPEKERDELFHFVDYTKIILNEKDQSIFLPHPKMRIGLGGIGKGYAVDQAFEWLKKRGLYNFSVNGSGDLRFHARPDAPRKWRVGIQNPFSLDQSKIVGVIEIQEGAVATSGGYKQFTKNEHHIINPKSGHSEHSIASATIIENNCIAADTAATIVMNLSAPLALEYLNQRNIFGALISSEGKSLLSNKALNHFGIL